MRRGRTLSNFSVVPNQKDNVIVTIEKRLCSGDDASALRYPVNDVMHDRGQLGALRRRESLCRLRPIQAQLPECMALRSDDAVQQVMRVKMTEHFVVIGRSLHC